MLLILFKLVVFNSNGDKITLHHLGTGKSNMKGIWEIAGCIAVMLLAFVQLSSNEYFNLGFLALLLCPMMHLLIHRNGHCGKTDQKKTPFETGAPRGLQWPATE